MTKAELLQSSSDVRLLADVFASIDGEPHSIIESGFYANPPMGKPASVLILAETDMIPADDLRV